jgi:hypothetical protein
VRGSIPGRVIYERHSSPLSLHYIEREVCAARLPASRRALLSKTRAAQPSGRAPLATPCLERAGPQHARAGPYPAPQVHTLLLPLGSQAAATPPRCPRKLLYFLIFPLRLSPAMLMGFSVCSCALLLLLHILFFLLFFGHKMNRNSFAKKSNQVTWPCHHAPYYSQPLLKEHTTYTYE